MALHVTVKGISSTQRPACHKHAKLKKQARMENEKMVYGLLNYLEDELEEVTEPMRESGVGGPATRRRRESPRPPTFTNSDRISG